LPSEVCKTFRIWTCDRDSLRKGRLAAAKEPQFQELFLHALVSAVGFYARWGFTPVGNVFDAAGIPHQAMRMAVH